MTERDTHPNASHFQFPYFFSDTRGICFRTIRSIVGDLLIFYDSLDGTNYIDGWCSRWDVDDYTITIETWITKDELDTLMNNIVPGATGELYQILSRPYFYDQTWEGNNTIRICPNNYTQHTPNTDEWSGDNLSNLPYMRDDTIIYVKNITTHPINFTGYIETKIEGYVSGTTL